MSLYVLDTDHVSLAQRSHSGLLRRLGATPPSDLATTMITVEEQLRGWLKLIRRVRRGPPLIVAYKSLHDTLTYFRGLRLLDFDEEASKRFESLLGSKIRVGTQDMRIAATVLSVDGVLLTRNYRHFALIPGLRLEDWTGG